MPDGGDNNEFNGVVEITKILLIRMHISLEKYHLTELMCEELRSTVKSTAACMWWSVSSLNLAEAKIAGVIKTKIPDCGGQGPGSLHLSYVGEKTEVRRSRVLTYCINSKSSRPT